MSNNYGIEERKRRWREFLDINSSERFVYIINYLPDAVERPPLWPINRQARIEWSLNSYYNQLERINWLKDDCIPYLSMDTGTEIFAEAFGCKVCRPDGDMPFALPLIQSASEASKLKVPKLESSSLAYLFDMADELKNRAGGNALLRMVDIQSPMDIVAQIWNKNDLFVALIQTPDAVKELAHKVRELLVAFFDEWFKRYGNEFIAHYPDYYMFEGITLSEDEIGSVSGQMFDQFFLDELNYLSNRYGGIGIHCCANARHHWDNLKKVNNLKLLNLANTNDYIEQAYSFFAHHVPQMHSWCGDGLPWTWPDTYIDGSHVVIQTVAKNREEALLLSEKLWGACGRN